MGVIDLSLQLLFLQKIYENSPTTASNDCPFLTTTCLKTLTKNDVSAEYHTSWLGASPFHMTHKSRHVVSLRVEISNIKLLRMAISIHCLICQRISGFLIYIA
ncbi:uncharacterized protein PHALS_15275 [Plasmopara halstedii]|uniref:Uncharacterized protein n=1 Tax=Plasmopara halstedii TaxID=4781 RepID=A0A0P1B6C4_PLAHL|nr:uncharacterized protein PHALS_15275 [Plasmopara halstedii]CEG50369.1 hypothetical protein PHALS_15275 [Plasmopara halstedii]|eukprot:XP_024586738.1 hypothetical protein PHALS_15275 [Plasmopara halstedii]